MRSFWNDRVLKDLTSVFSSLDLSSRESIIDALFCGYNPFDLNQYSVESVSGAAAAADYTADRERMYKYLRYITPRREERHVKKKRFCGNITVHPDSKCTFLEGAAQSQFMILISGYILVAPASPVVHEFVQKNLVRYLKLLNEAGLIKTELFEQLSALLATMFDSSDDPSSLLMLAKSLSLYLEEILKCFVFDRFVVVSDEKELVDRALCLMDYQQYMTGIVFLHLDENSTQFPSSVTYKIRHPPNFIDSTKDLMDSFGHLVSRDNFLVDMKYLTFGFSFLQESIDRILIESISGRKHRTGLYAQQEPYKCIIMDK
ncbi:unnamed protein product [Gongylonema pulchrum]|uniref:Uncharacterized protein n=1 Tax=Gongylonema pulchrum TaxID=637853 RepID=A0A183CVZ8_9BILA|nr:unnamed protein product [Gongylonema pulchrum]